MIGGRGPALLLTLLVLPALLAGAPAAAAPSDVGMVAEQVEARGIDDARVLDALRRVPRAAFVPPEMRWRAHDDEPIPIGHGQTISQPYVVALMTTILDVGPNQKVLEIGTGSGYQAAVLSHLAREVYTVEIVPELASSARLRLTRQGIRNVHVREGDGNYGWEHYAPFDRIVVTAAAARVPEALVEQLVEGGVLVMPVGDPDAVQMLIRGVKRGGKLYAHPVRKLRFVPLTGDVGGRAATSGDGRPPRGALSEEGRSGRPAPPDARSRAVPVRAARDRDRPSAGDAGARVAPRCGRATA